jgi:hypothetical protein
MRPAFVWSAPSLRAREVGPMALVDLLGKGLDLPQAFSCAPVCPSTSARGPGGIAWSWSVNALA